jgi:multidrug efflux pump subunit AcrA (membrane-fusion protein)
MRGRLGAAAAAVVLLLGQGGGGEGAAALRSGEESPQPKAFRGEFTRELLLTGELEAVRSVAIKAPQTAIFQMRIQFMAEEGAVVREGDPLLDFDNAALADRVLDLETQILDAEIQIVAMRNRMETALKDLEIELAGRQYAYGIAEVEASVESGILSRREHGKRQLALETTRRELEEILRRIDLTREEGEAEVDVLLIGRDRLQQELASARHDLELLSIQAPADGLVIYERRPRSTSHFQEGDSCWPGQTVLRLPDLSAMQVLFHVNEVDVQSLKVGLPVLLTMDSFPGRALAGRIERIPSMAVTKGEQSRVRIFQVVATLSETWGGEMKPGMSIRGRVAVDRRADVPMVARETVRVGGDAYWLSLPAVEDDAGPASPVRIHPVARNAWHYVLDETRDARVVEALGLSAAGQSVAGAGTEVMP